MSGQSKLDLLREAKSGLDPEQARRVDDLLLGILSVLVDDRVWIDAVQLAVRMARREKPQG
jgi:hypothetical protein